MERVRLLSDNVVWVKPSELKVKDGFNPRFEFGDLQWLEHSILKYGVIKPLLVRRETMEIIDGGRRHRASCNVALLQPDLEIPVTFYDGTNEMKCLQLALLSNDGKPLLPIEEASAYARIRQETQCSVKALAEFVGKKESYVAERLILLDASPEVQEAVKDQSVPVSTAQEIIRATGGDHGQQKELIAKAKEGKQGRREVREKIEQKRAERRPAKPIHSFEFRNDRFKITTETGGVVVPITHQLQVNLPALFEGTLTTAVMASELRRLAKEIEKL